MEDKAKYWKVLKSNVCNGVKGLVISLLEKDFTESQNV